MSKRTPVFLIIVIVALLSLGLTACEKERPVPTPSRATPAPARGTASPTVPAVLTQVAPSALSGAVAGQATPITAGTATPMAPTPQPVVVNPAGTSGSTGSGQVTTYTVVAGDTLASIAAKFGTVPEAIAQLNNLTDPNALTVGQQLKIAGTPSAGTSTAGATGATGDTGKYVVQAGDTLQKIAQRFGTTVAQLVQLNSLTNPNLISIGQTLIVPAAGGAAAAPATGTTTTGGAATSGQTKSYTVQSGDTLLKIARKFGLTVQQLQTANKIANPDRIYPGQVLVIP
jgi:LysM repeat protein